MDSSSLLDSSTIFYPAVPAEVFMLMKLWARIRAYFKREEAYAKGEIKNAEQFAEAIAASVAAKVTAAIKGDLAKIKAAIPTKKRGR